MSFSNTCRIICIILIPVKNTTCELYRTKPGEKITVSEITRKAGYNRATFYDYFLDVYDLLEQIEEELINHIGEKITNTISNGNFANIFLEAFDDMQKNAEKYFIVLLTGEHSSKFSDKLKKSIMPVIISAFRIPTDDLKAVYALDFYLSGIISVVSEWQKNDKELSTDELGSLVHTLLTEGVLKAIGQKEITQHNALWPADSFSPH